ncbi:MAG: hypothetical protein ACJ8G1_06650 [Vitreoscilla sp.]
MTVCFWKNVSQIVVGLACGWTFAAGAATSDPDLNVPPGADFVDAVGQYSAKAFTGMRSGQPMAWFDERQVILSLEAPADHHSDGELNRIVLLNTHTGEVKDTPYRGRLVCFSKERMVIDQGLGAIHDVRAGAYGETLQNVAGRGDLGVSRVGCRQPPVQEHQIKYELQPGDGSLVVDHSQQYIDSNAVPVTFYGPDGRFVRRIEVPWQAVPHGANFSYLAWAKSYLNRGVYGQYERASAGGMFTAAGEFENLVPPSFMREAAEKGQVAALVYPSRVGRLWVLWPQRGFESQQGLYLEASGKLLRIDDHRVNGDVEVSSDGCSVFYRQVSKDQSSQAARSAAVKYQFVSFNVCS